MVTTEGVIPTNPDLFLFSFLGFDPNFPPFFVDLHPLTYSQYEEIGGNLAQFPDRPAPAQSGEGIGAVVNFQSHEFVNIDANIEDDEGFIMYATINEELTGPLEIFPRVDREASLIIIRDGEA